MNHIFKIKIDESTDLGSIVNLFGVVYEQVKLQQEVRDRWFEHYISIIGAMSALATICFGYYSGKVEERYLMMILCLIFLFSGIIGALFYLLYIKQRINYLKEYRELKIISDKIYRLLFSIDERRRMQAQFVKKNKGADFVTLLIENLICSSCMALSALFAFLSLGISVKNTIILALCIYIVISIILYRVSKRMEGRL